MMAPAAPCLICTLPVCRYRCWPHSQAPVPSAPTPHYKRRGRHRRKARPLSGRRVYLGDAGSA
uniref:Uncharacterized protein n=1 Tax=Setaria italica TaxID=4555 RepID=K4ANU5_SETIT